MECAKKQGYNMQGGYLFSGFDPVTKQRVKMLPVQMTTQLKKYKLKVGLRSDDQGALSRSMHSFRSGGAISKILEGEALETVMKEAYWKSPRTAIHYMKILEVLQPMGEFRQGVTEEENKKANEMPLQECARLCQAY
jgi:hypothetical protein